MICRPCPVFWTAKIGELSSAKQNFLKKNVSAIFTDYLTAINTNTHNKIIVCHS
jgi:hypothetical protein